MAEIKREAKFWGMSKELSHDIAGRGNSVYIKVWRHENSILGSYKFYEWDMVSVGRRSGCLKCR